MAHRERQHRRMHPGDGRRRYSGRTTPGISGSLADWDSIPWERMEQRPAVSPTVRLPTERYSTTCGNTISAPASGRGSRAVERPAWPTRTVLTVLNRPPQPATFPAPGGALRVGRIAMATSGCSAAGDTLPRLQRALDS